MDKIKKVYIDSRYKTNGCLSNSDFKFELSGALGLGENADRWYINSTYLVYCWNYNNKLYIEATDADLTLSVSIWSIASGNYTAASLAATLNNILQIRFPNDNCSCVYNISVGTITISSSLNFRTMTDEFVKSLQGNIGGWYINNTEEIGHPDYNNLRSINEVIRNSTISSPNTSFETGFIDLLNVHFILLI